MARGDELRELLRKHRVAGGEAYMLTLTLPHDAGDELEPMRRHVAQAWRYCQTGAPWRRLKDRLRILGTVRALEVKVGPSGWHPHLHVLLVLERPLEPAVREELVAWVYRRWAERITRPNKDTGKTYRRPSLEHGVTLTVSYDDTYITKLGLADELAKASFKDRGELHRTPLQLLHDVHRFREAYDVARWREYAVAMHGARQLTYSKGLRARYNLPAEQTDAELGEELERGPALVGASIDAQAWDELVAKDVHLQLRILAAVEREDTGEARQWAVECLLDKARGLAPPPF